jgi:hypothetical protein
MYNQPVEAQNASPETLYQMDQTMFQSLHKMKQQVHGQCAKHINRPVRVQTIHGQTYEGYIVHIDAVILYLKPMTGHVRGFLDPYSAQNTYTNVILPLVLYELLVITLL